MIAKYIGKVVFDVVSYAEACVAYATVPNYDGYKEEVRVSPSGELVVCSLNFGRRTPPKGGCTYGEFATWKEFRPKGELIWFVPDWRGNNRPEKTPPPGKEGRLLVSTRSRKPRTKSQLWEFV